MPANLDVELPQLLFQHHVCLYAAMIPALIIMDYTSEPVSQPQLVSFIRIVMVMIYIHSNKILTKTEVATSDRGIAVIGMTMLVS